MKKLLKNFHLKDVVIIFYNKNHKPGFICVATSAKASKLKLLPKNLASSKRLGVLGVPASELLERHLVRARGDAMEVAEAEGGSSDAPTS